MDSKWHRYFRVLKFDLYMYVYIQSTKNTEIKYIWYIIEGHRDRGVGQREGVGKGKVWEGKVWGKGKV